jgi:hypothetical protein
MLFLSACMQVDPYVFSLALSARASISILFCDKLKQADAARATYLCCPFHTTVRKIRTSAEGVCTDEFLSRKPGFLLSAMHSHAFRWFSAAPLVFLFLGLLPLQMYQIWRIFCVMYGEECGWTLFVWLQKLYLTEMFEWLLSYIQL